MITQAVKSIFKPIYQPFRKRYEERLIAIYNLLIDLREEQKKTVEACDIWMSKIAVIEQKLDWIQKYLERDSITDARIWKAEQNIIQTTDARIWKEEQNILHAIELQAYKNNKLVPQTRLARLTVHLVEHCNLNCQCCDNFSPIAEKEYADFEKLKKNFSRLVEIGGRSIGILELSGGEALLHPQISQFIPMSREAFPDSEIRIVSNGILLAEMPDEFWKVCSKNNVRIALTKYPININPGLIKGKAEKHGVEWKYFDNTEIKTTYYIPFDIKGKQDPNRNFINCFHANSCVCMQGERIYTCPIAAYLHHFNKHFNEDLPDVTENSIDIYKAESMDDILKFISKPISLCKYCDVDGRRFNLPWSISKMKKGEWVSNVKDGEDRFELQK